MKDDGSGMLAIEVFLLILMVAAYTIYRLIRSTRKKLPPGPFGLPFVGYLPFLDAKNPHLSLMELSKKYGKIYSLQMGGIFTVVLTDVKLIRQVLAMDAFSGRAPLYLTHGIMKGNGIICVQGRKWKDQRKFVVGCLRSFGMVKYGSKRLRMEADIRAGVNELIEKIKSANKKPLDTEKLLMHSVGNVVFNLVFGKKWSEDDETWNKLMALQERGTKLIGVAGPINFLPILKFLPKYKNAISYIKEGMAYSHELYQEILRDYISTVSSTKEANHFLGAFYREMTKENSKESFFTAEQFNYLMADLWGAGVDTTITTLRWFFLYTAFYKEVQDNIQQEMDHILGEKTLTFDDVPSLPYLEASISEAQRIRSVTPLGIPHGTLEDSVLYGYDIPKGTMFIPLQWAIHMDPMYHDDPNTFNPHRFLDEDGNYIQHEAFIPFQTGKRMCLGKDYAMMLLFLYAGVVLQNFVISLETTPKFDDFDGEVGITLTPKHHKIIFSPRKRKPALLGN